MKITYLTNQYRENRNLCMKIAEPDDGATERFVLALHGFAGSMESWAITALAERLTAQRTAVLAFNYAGHGTDTQDELFSVENCLADYRGAIALAQNRYPDAEWCGVFATSFGGFLTLNLCGEIPAAVNIVLRAPAVNMADVFARIVEDEGGGMARYQQEGTVTLGDARKLNVPYPFYQELIEKDVFQRNFDRQMLLIHGDCDTVVLPDDTAAFCARNPKITREIIHGADHLFLHAGELDQVMALAVPWLMRTASGI